MRKPTYLSHSSVDLFYSDTKEFYLKYLTEHRPPRMSQTQPMSIGSAFDAYIKSDLSIRLFGKDRGYDFEELFEQQVEKHNRDWAKENGLYVYNAYKQSGALADLLIELDQASEEPKFEMRVEANISHTTNQVIVPMLGYPDIYFKSRDGVPIIYDWKVNGYCGQSGTSPAKGYVKCRDAWDHDILGPSRSHNKKHKDARLEVREGITYNAACCLSEVDKKWAAQTCIYGWMLGVKVGDPFIAGIDQITKYKTTPYKPLLRVSTLRHLMDTDYQNVWFGQICHVWETIKSGHIFRDMNLVDSNALCAKLDNTHLAYGDQEDPSEQWFSSITRRHKW